MERSCNAIPTCNVRSKDCYEENGFSIAVRSVPKTPTFSAATYPSIQTANRFTRDSIMITIKEDNEFYGDYVDKYMIEWSTDSSFVDSNYNETLSTNSLEYIIEQLRLGEKYFVRVSAHNSAGYSKPSLPVIVKPIQSPDPPFSPLVLLLPTSSYRTEESGTSLHIEWEYPKAELNTYQVGDGGDEITHYLVELSKVDWNEYTPTIWRISFDDSIGSLHGYFRLCLDTTNQSSAAIRGRFISAKIPVNSSAHEIKILLQNLPNIGEVLVSFESEFSWTLTFLTEVGNFDGLSIEENSSYLIDNDSIGSLTINLVQVGIIPETSAYSSITIESSSLVSMTQLVENLVPGQKYFIRMAARNSLGFGKRLETAPRVIAIPIQKPGPPSSFAHSMGSPTLRVSSRSSLSVHIGPPHFNGGSPITQFLVEWDTKFTFDSNDDGSSLGKAYIRGKQSICSACITSFDSHNGTFFYNGNIDLMKILVPQRTISVYFYDDDYHYQFVVKAASTSQIKVQQHHFRVGSSIEMKNESGYNNVDLYMIGAEFNIQNLTEGERYYVRVSAENSEMGTGQPVACLPEYEVPRGASKMKGQFKLSTIDKHTLEVDWSDVMIIGGNKFTSVLIELFSKSERASEDLSFFGAQEVVEIDTAGSGLSGGVFALSVGNFEIEIPIRLQVRKHSDFVSSQFDHTQYFNRGDEIMIDGEIYFVDLTGFFSPTILPLSKPFVGDDSNNARIFKRPKTPYLPFDVSAEDLRLALENLPSVGRLSVRRVEQSPLNEFKWIITFLDVAGPQPLFSIDSSFLLGENPKNVKQTILIRGKFPDEYFARVVNDLSVERLKISELKTGVNYYARIRPLDDQGHGALLESTPLSTFPGQVPDAPLAPIVSPYTENSILLTYEQDVNGNGVEVDEFFIEVDSSSSFDNPMKINDKIDGSIQRLIVNAQTIPWNASSTFTLSLGENMTYLL